MATSKPPPSSAETRQGEHGLEQGHHPMELGQHEVTAGWCSSRSRHRMLSLPVQSTISPRRSETSARAADRASMTFSVTMLARPRRATPQPDHSSTHFVRAPRAGLSFRTSCQQSPSVLRSIQRRGITLAIARRSGGGLGQRPAQHQEVDSRLFFGTLVDRKPLASVIMLSANQERWSRCSDTVLQLLLAHRLDGLAQAVRHGHGQLEGHLLHLGIKQAQIRGALLPHRLASANAAPVLNAPKVRLPQSSLRSAQRGCE